MSSPLDFPGHQAPRDARPAQGAQVGERVNLFASRSWASERQKEKGQWNKNDLPESSPAFLLLPFYVFLFSQRWYVPMSWQNPSVWSCMASSSCCLLAPAGRSK